ncbi:MAG: helix-turn-helix domain-containing protein [Candidatus Eremiobacteraeota bacterium]|nr:helix-turn-helix domain-containing protein [Candidatus Eremiobacteraeota bacterium]
MFEVTKLREEKKWSKSELSRRSGLNLPLISQLESGKIFPYPGWRKKIGKALEVKPDILFQEVNEDDKPSE